MACAFKSIIFQIQNPIQSRRNYDWNGVERVCFMCGFNIHYKKMEGLLSAVCKAVFIVRKAV